MIRFFYKYVKLTCPSRVLSAVLFPHEMARRRGQQWIVAPARIDGVGIDQMRAPVLEGIRNGERKSVIDGAPAERSDILAGNVCDGGTDERTALSGLSVRVEVNLQGSRRVITVACPSPRGGVQKPDGVIQGRRCGQGG